MHLIQFKTTKEKIWGSIYNSTDQPIRNAKVGLDCGGKMVDTDRLGRFKIKLKPRVMNCNIIVAADEYVSRRVPVDLKNDKTISFFLKNELEAQDSIPIAKSF